MSYLTGFYNFFQDEAGTDDFVDKLGRRHMVTALALTTVVVAGAEYIGSPINCFTPNGYTGNQVDFINSVCFTQSLYYVYNENWNSSQPLLGSHLTHGKNIPMRGAKMVNYYKYVPIVLMLMAFFFVLPNYIWQVMLSLLSGSNVDNIVDASTDLLDPVSEHVTDEQADLVADRLLQQAQLNRAQRESGSRRANLLFQMSGGSWVTKLRYSTKPLFPGCRLFGAYLAMKVLYIADVVLTLWGVSVFLDVSPWEYLGKIFRGLSFRPEYAFQFSGRFPTVSICQYTGEAQVMGKLLRLTNICVIPFNVYYDKIFAAFYLLFVVYLVLLVASVFAWLYKVQCRGCRGFFGKYLDIASPSLVNPALKKLDAIATTDMIFILTMLENNTDGIVTYNIVNKLSEKLLATENSGTKANGLGHHFHNESKKDSVV